MKPNLFYTGNRFRDALLAFMFGRAMQGLAHFILMLWVVRLLGLSDYGAYMTLWGIVDMTAPLSSLGMLEAARRFLPDLATRGNTGAVYTFIKWATLVRFTILFAWAGGIALLWPTLAGWIGFSAVQASQSWVAVPLIVTVLGFRYAAEMLETLLEQRWSQLARALMPIGQLLGVSILVGMGAVSLSMLLWVDLIASLFCLLLAEWALYLRLGRLNVAGNHHVTLREVTNFAWNMSGANLLHATASAGALRLIAARVLGLEAMGLYSFLQQLLNIINRYMPAQLLANIIRPMLIARRAAGETEVVSLGMGLMWKSNLLIVLVGIAVFAIVGDTTISVVSGRHIDGGGFVMLVLLLGLGASSQGMLINMALQIYDRTGALRALSLLILLVPIAGWFAGKFGLASFVAGIAAARWLHNGFALWWIQRNGVRIALDFAGLARTIILVVVTMAPMWFIGEQMGAFRAFIATVALLLLAFLLARPLSQSDETILKRALKSNVRFLRPFVYARK